MEDVILLLSLLIFDTYGTHYGRSVGATAGTFP